MNVARIITVSIVLGSVTLWVVWDVIAVIVWGRSATESIFIFAWTLKYPQLVFVLGYLMGHFTWGQKPDWTERKANTIGVDDLVDEKEKP